jgi:hypothetical protein
MGLVVPKLGLPEKLAIEKDGLPLVLAHLVQRLAAARPVQPY